MRHVDEMGHYGQISAWASGNIMMGEVFGDNPKYTIQVNHIFGYKNTNKIS